MRQLNKMYKQLDDVKGHESTMSRMISLRKSSKNVLICKIFTETIQIRERCKNKKNGDRHRKNQLTYQHFQIQTYLEKYDFHTLMVTFYVSLTRYYCLLWVSQNNHESFKHNFRSHQKPTFMLIELYGKKITLKSLKYK